MIKTIKYINVMILQKVDCKILKKSIIKLLCIFSYIFLINNTYNIKILNASNNLNKSIFPCQVRFEFSKDKKGKNISYYQLYIQYTNKKPQPISSISLHWLDDKNNILGNSDADCRFEGSPLGVYQTGECTKIIKTINSGIIQQIGEQKWLDLINYEMERFNRIKNCIVIGQRYSK